MFDLTMYQSADFDMFLEQLQAKGFAVKIGKYLSVLPPYGERYIRLESLGEYYTQYAIRARFNSKKQIAERLDAVIEQNRTANTLYLCSLLETKHYMAAFSQGALPMRRKEQTKPFMWKNDAELDQLLILNRLLKKGLTEQTLREKAETLGTDAQKKAEELKLAESRLREFAEMKEKIEIVFEHKASDAFTLEEAKAAVRMYPEINSMNYRNIENVVKPAQENVQRLSAEYQAVLSELKQVTDSLSIIERVKNHTYVNGLIETEKRIRQEEKTNEHENYSSM